MWFSLPEQAWKGEKERGGGGGEVEGGDEAQAQFGTRVSTSQDLAMEEEEQGGSSCSPAIIATDNGTS